MRYSIFIIVLGIIMTSCSEEATSEIGSGFYEGIETRVYYIDTLTVNLSTFQFDSLQVSGAERLLIGSYNDPVFGKTKSSSYFQLENSVYGIDDDAVFDSIAMILKYDKYVYNDTIPTQQFSVYQVSETIKPKDDDDLYYNTNSFDYNSNPIGTKLFNPKPNKNDSLNIEISNDFGSILFNKLKNNDINNNDEFLDEYKGLYIAPSDNNTSILGFDKTSVLRIYYTIYNEDQEPTVETIDLSINSTNSFSNTGSNQTGTYFDAIVDQETLLSSISTNNNSFVQSGSGLATRVDIPNIESLFDIPGEGVVINALLKISLKNETNENLITRDQLQVLILDDKSNVIGNLTYDDGSTPVEGLISNDNPEFESDVYTFDINTFIDIKLNETNEEFFLGIYPQDFNNSVDRYIFNDAYSNNDLQLKLEITYAVYDE